MASNANGNGLGVYLASSMLRSHSPSELLQALERDCRGKTTIPQGDTTWDLTTELNKGIIDFSFNSRDRVLQAGKILGISWMRSTLPDVEEEHMHIWAHELAQHLLVNHLVIASNSKFFDFTQASAFVVQFYDSRPLTPAALYPIVEEQMAGFTKESIEAVANTCHSYQALTFDGIVDAVDQITDLLEKRRKLHGLDNDKFPSRLLVLEGIDQSLEEITRSSSVLLAQAKLAPLLQKLTIISHTFFPKLSILIVNSVGSSPFITASHPAPALNSIFAVPATEPGLVQKSHLSYSSPLAKSLDRAIDTHLLVSHVGPNITVEVAKDRTGDALGRWCVL